MNNFLEKVFDHYIGDRPATSFKLTYLTFFIIYNWKLLYLLVTSDNFLEEYRVYLPIACNQPNENYEVILNIADLLCNKFIIFGMPFLASLLALFLLTRVLHWTYKQQLNLDSDKQIIKERARLSHEKRKNDLLTKTVLISEKNSLLENKIEDDPTISPFFKKFIDSKYGIDGAIYLDKVSTENFLLFNEFMDLYNLGEYDDIKSSRSNHNVWKLTREGKAYRRKYNNKL